MKSIRQKLEELGLGSRRENILDMVKEKEKRARNIPTICTFNPKR